MGDHVTIVVTTEYRDGLDDDCDELSFELSQQAGRRLITGVIWPAGGFDPLRVIPATNFSREFSSFAKAKAVKSAGIGF